MSTARRFATASDAVDLGAVDITGGVGVDALSIHLRIELEASALADPGDDNIKAWVTLYNGAGFMLGVCRPYGMHNVYWLLATGTGAFDGTGSLGNALVADGAWHSLVVTWFAHTCTVWLDGTQLAANNSAFHVGGVGHLGMNTGHLSLGNGNTIVANAAQSLCDVGFWSSILSPGDIAALAGGSPACTVSLPTLLAFTDPADTAKLFDVGASPVTATVTGTTAVSGPTLGSPYAILATPSATSLTVTQAVTIATAFGPYGSPGGTIAITPTATGGTVSPTSGAVGTTFTYTAGTVAGSYSVTFANDGGLTAPVVNLTANSLPAQLRSATVGASGQTIALQFERASDHTDANVTALATPPTIKVSGSVVPIGSPIWLDAALGTGTYPFAIVPIQQPPAATAIVTDKDPGFLSTGGGWSVATGQYFAYNSDQTQHLTTAAGDTASWTFTGLTAGTYRVGLNWIAYAPQNCDHVAASVHDGATVGATTLGTVAVNQRLGPQGLSTSGVSWTVLGQFTITGTSLTVGIANAAGSGWMWAGPCLVRRVVTEAAIAAGAPVTLSAAANWATTSAGGVNPYVDWPVTNHAGHPFAGDFVAGPKRMEIGYNIEPMGFGHPYPFANFKYATQGGWYGGVDGNGNLVAIGGGAAYAIFMQGTENGVDRRGLASSPGVAGSGRWKLRYSIPSGSNPAGNFCSIVAGGTLGQTDATTVTVAVAEHTAGDGKREVEYNVVCDPNRNTPILAVYATDLPGHDFEVYGPSLANPNVALTPDPAHPWNPELLAALTAQKVTSLRGLDLCAMGNNNNGVAFSDLTQPSDDRRYYNEPIWYSLPNLASISAVDVTSSDLDGAVAWFYYAWSLKATFVAPHGCTTGQQISVKGMNLAHPAYGPAGALAGYTLSCSDVHGGAQGGAVWVVVVDAVTVLISSYNAFGPAIYLEPSLSTPASWPPGTVETPGGATWTAQCYRKYGVPVQMFLDLCNRIPGCVPWVNIPILFSDAAIADLTDAVLAARPPGEPTNFETSNEPWNFGFMQCQVCTFHANYETAQYNLGVPGALPAAHSGPYWYGWKAARVFAIVRARAAAAGRATDVTCALNVQHGNAGATTAPSLDGWTTAAVGFPVDLVAGATYIDTPEFGAPMSDAFAALTDGQWLDTIEVSDALTAQDNLTHYHYEFMQSRGFTVLDGAGRYVSGAKFVNYEGGPQFIVHNGYYTAGFAVYETSHRIYHHPRYRDVGLAYLQRLEDEDTFLFNRFFLQGTSYYPTGQAMWTTHPGYSLETGLGDGSDGKFDNRTNPEDARAVSVFGDAMRTWGLLVAPAGPSGPSDFQFSAAMRNARLDVMASVLAVGGRLKAYTGAPPGVGNAASGTLLCTLTALSFAAASGGTKTFSATPAAAVASGTPGYIRLETAAGAVHAEFTAGVGAGEISFNTAVSAGGTVSLNSGMFTEGNA